MSAITSDNALTPAGLAAEIAEIRGMVRALNARHEPHGADLGTIALARALGCPGRCAIACPVALGAALSRMRRLLDAIDRMEGGGR
jgi:hypothetical protein